MITKSHDHTIPYYALNNNLLSFLITIFVLIVSMYSLHGHALPRFVRRRTHFQEAIRLNGRSLNCTTVAKARHFEPLTLVLRTLWQLHQLFFAIIF